MGVQLACSPKGPASRPAAASPSMHRYSQRLSLAKNAFANSRGKLARRHNANGDAKRLDQQFLQFP